FAGRRAGDLLTDEIPFDKIPDYTLFCTSTDLKGIRIATVIHNAALLAEERWNATTSLQRMKLKQADFPSSIAAYLETLTTNPRGIRTLEDLIDHTKTEPDEDYPNHNLERFEIAASLDPGS
ncbi:hypothetical protein B0T21DRAFT_288605, partial [Apiosordaria backusii]